MKKLPLKTIVIPFLILAVILTFSVPQVANAGGVVSGIVTVLKIAVVLVAAAVTAGAAIFVGASLFAAGSVIVGTAVGAAVFGGVGAACLVKIGGFCDGGGSGSSGSSSGPGGNSPGGTTETSNPPDYHLACGQGACVQVPNGFAGQGNDDGCTVEGAACGGGGGTPGGGGSGGRFKCTGNGAECAFVPGDIGTDQCSPPSDNVCGGAGTDNGGSVGNGSGVGGGGGGSGGGAGGGGTGSGTGGTGSGGTGGGVPQTHNVCQGDGSCTSVNGAGISQCRLRSDCPQPSPTCSFSASPDRVIVPPPATVTLSWSCRYADACTISGIGPVGASGNQNVSVNKDTTYTISCSGAGGPGSFSTTVRAFEYSGGKLKEVAP